MRARRAPVRAWAGEPPPILPRRRRRRSDARRARAATRESQRSELPDPRPRTSCRSPGGLTPAPRHSHRRPSHRGRATPSAGIEARGSPPAGRPDAGNKGADHRLRDRCEPRTWRATDCGEQRGPRATLVPHPRRRPAPRSRSEPRSRSPRWPSVACSTTPRSWRGHGSHGSATRRASGACPRAV